MTRPGDYCVTADNLGLLLGVSGVDATAKGGNESRHLSIASDATEARLGLQDG